MAQLASSSGVPVDREQRMELAEKVAREVSQIATLPEITLRIIEVVENPNSTAKDLQQIISNDPALCARILKVVNSAFYALPQQIGSIDRAVVLLGLNAIKNIAISSSLVKLFRGGRISKQFSARDVWTHSAAVAAASNLIAERSKIELPDQAFHAGLIHDLGLMVEMQSMRMRLVQALDRMNQTDASFLDCERKIMGADHQDFGYALCKLWKFPEGFCRVVGFHHQPLELPEEERPLVTAVHLADVMVSNLGLGFCAGTPSLKIQPALLDQLGLTETDLQNVLAEIPGAFEEAAGLMEA